MPPPDAVTLVQTARRLRLLSEEQFTTIADEIDLKSMTPESALRFLERKAYLTPWQGAKLIKGDTDGFFLGGYRLLYRIAAGSFGRVFRADDPRTGEIFAVKVLRKRWTEDQHKIELFEREGKVGLTLQHPNIVRILAVNRDQPTGQYYIVMEFVEGGNLRDFLSIRKKLQYHEALKILEETASGLALAYSRGLTHRDIKPTNILISTQGTAKLVDFGLAEITGAAAEEDDTEVDRTVDYAGLEKATKVKAGDVRSDIYFLGNVFHEMLTGRPLLTPTKDKYARQNASRFAVAENIRRDDPDLPPEVLPILDKMVALDPTARYQTPAQLYEAVRALREKARGAEQSGLRTVAGPKTIYIVEHSQRLQDAFRQKFKELGFRVLISVDVTRALARYQQQPFHAILVDGGTTGEDGVAHFDRVMKEAETLGLHLAGLLVLSENQTTWCEHVLPRDNVAILIRPVTMRQLTDKLLELMPSEKESFEAS